MKRELVKQRYKRAYSKFNIKKLKVNYKNSELIMTILFFIIITTGLVTTYSISSFRSDVTNNSTARIAKFIVKTTENSNKDLAIDCNSSNTMNATYSFTVTNQENSIISDVAINYDVVVKFSEKLLDGTTLILTTENGNKTASGGQTEYVFENAGTFSATNGKSNSHTLTINATTDVNSYFDGTMKVSVRAKQVN